MFKIDFCVVGPQRTGSTWLYEILKKFDIACLPDKVKETYFFDKNYQKGAEFYRKFFACSEMKVDELIGEVATTYFDNSVVPLRIKQHNLDCKIIIIYRNPIERAISLYNHHKRKGRINTDIIKSIELFPSIIQGGKYSKWIPLWIQVFGAKNVNILNYNDLRNNPQKYINDLLNFLGKDGIALSLEDMLIVNESTSPKNPLIAKFATNIAGFLRKIGFHKVVNYGKKIGLNKVYSGGTIDGITEVEREKLKSFFSNEDFLYD